MTISWWLGAWIVLIYLKMVLNCLVYILTIILNRVSTLNMHAKSSYYAINGVRTLFLSESLRVSICLDYSHLSYDIFIYGYFLDVRRALIVQKRVLRKKFSLRVDLYLLKIIFLPCHPFLYSNVSFMWKRRRKLFHNYLFSIT